MDTDLEHFFCIEVFESRFDELLYVGSVDALDVAGDVLGWSTSVARMLPYLFPGALGTTTCVRS
ncbi:MAG: hypothetical protein O2992_11230 [Gemmatimonadetes bacterium]|jgi:hypothetical protein|nr:hypothetical protein [Gemmatimonadota bacterium]